MIDDAWVRQNMLRRQDGGKEKMRTFARDGDGEKLRAGNPAAARRVII
jgi:hypothetical protein